MGKPIFESSNKRIWLYWHQGWDEAPQLVARCVTTWIQRNPDWKIHLLDKDTLGNFLALPDYLAGINPPLPALSDIIRIHLLNDYGGVWADATTWCARPLSDWLNEKVSANGFFAYEKPGPKRPLSTWFLAVPGPSYVVTRWKDAVDTFWQCDSKNLTISDQPTDEHYFWFHSLFSELLVKDEKFAALWNSRASISADPSHHLQRRGLLRKCEADDMELIRNSPDVHKLTRRLAIPEDISGTILEALYRHG